MFFMFFKDVELDSIEKIFLNYHHRINYVNTEITDAEDFTKLIQICRGQAKDDSVKPSCSFGAVELVFQSKNKQTSIYPACDDSPGMRLGEENRFYYFLKDDKREELEKILRKYVVEFPCE